MSLLMDHTSRPGDVADPWYTGDFEATWQDVLEGCTAMVEQMFHGGATAKGALIITPEKAIVTTPGADNKKEL